MKSDSTITSMDGSLLEPNLGSEGLNLGRLDKLGASASLACAVHCAVLPFVVTLLPVYGLSFLVGETVEWILVGVAVSLAAVSLLLGYRQHRSVRVLTMLSAAVVLLVVGHLTGHEASHLGGAVPLNKTILAVAGGLILVGAHILNYRLCKSCRRCTDGCSSAS